MHTRTRARELYNMIWTVHTIYYYASCGLITEKYKGYKIVLT